jgi:hypothetical protein
MLVTRQDKRVIGKRKATYCDTALSCPKIELRQPLIRPARDPKRQRDLELVTFRPSPQGRARHDALDHSTKTKCRDQKIQTAWKTISNEACSSATPLDIRRALTSTMFVFPLRLGKTHTWRNALARGKNESTCCPSM